MLRTICGIVYFIPFFTILSVKLKLSTLGNELQALEALGSVLWQQQHCLEEFTDPSIASSSYLQLDLHLRRINLAL